ncbi:helix-turn-helix domain-containing protein [Aeromicrobium sp. CFBP 8757]|uniref:IclR family transcriptional regulator domain-containing protein n=1 Tax=Aeromicrobium sp. CFBP 8757 TaxID=2775288 RepID=UPI00178242AB|nr:helix-turn-helix domain-containing protein [Aeromicrobium sp. CFBP 8757]
MAKRGEGADFVEALARGLDVIECLGTAARAMSLSEIATASDLARPTARRLLLTLAELGFVRVTGGSYDLTPKVLRLGMAYVGSTGLWDVARPHMEDLVRTTGESTSMTQLDGSDIVYVARVAVPKIIAIRVEIGTRFPAVVTSQGKVLLAALDADALDTTLRIPSRAPGVAVPSVDVDRVRGQLATIREQGWALADEELAPGVRSVAVPVRDASGRTVSAMNVTVNAAETSVETLTQVYLPALVRTAAEVSADWALLQGRPQSEVSAVR